MPRILPTCFSACLLAAPAAAQEEIVVTGRALDRPAASASESGMVIERERLVGAASGRLEEILRDVPNFQLFRRSDSRVANPTSQGATLRGIGGNATSRALVTLDGVPIADPFAGWIAWPALPPASLADVRIVTGTAAGPFAPGALTGRIELASAGPADRENYAALRYGSRDSLDLDAGFVAALGSGFATLDGQYARGDGYIPVAPEDRGVVDIPAAYEQGGAALRAVFPLGAAGELQTRLAVFDDRRNRGQRLVDSRNDGADLSLRYVARGALPLEAIAYVQLRDYEARFARTAPDRGAEQPALDQDVPATGYGAKLELRPGLFRIGVDWQRAAGETRERFDFDGAALVGRREAGGRREIAGLFAGADVQFGEAFVIAGDARLDRWWLSRGRFAQNAARTDFPDRSGWEASGRLGAAYQLTPALKLRGAAYTGWRLPTLNELYRPFRVGPDATAANAALVPERSYGAEIGADYRPLSTASASLTLFALQAENAIANVTLGQGPGVFPEIGFVFGSFRQRLNVDAVEAYGMEANANLALGRWRFAAAYALTESEVEGSGQSAGIDGFRPPQVPCHRASFSAAYELPGSAHAEASLRYASEQFEDDREQRPLGGFVTLDARVTVPLAGGLALTAAGENLTDTRIEDGIDVRGATTLAQPRTLWIGLRWTG